MVVANLYEAGAGTLSDYMVLIGFEVAAERTFKWSGWILQCLKNVSSVPAFVIHLPYSEDFCLIVAVLILNALTAYEVVTVVQYWGLGGWPNFGPALNASLSMR